MHIRRHTLFTGPSNFVTSGLPAAELLGWQSLVDVKESARPNNQQPHRDT